MPSPERVPGLGLGTMRRLDRWLGLPLCWLASLALRLTGGRRRSPRQAPSGRVLYVALAEMGSIVLAAPAIRAQAARMGTKPIFVTLAPTRPVFDFLGADFAADVQVLRTGSLFALAADLVFFAWSVRRSGVAVAIDLDPGARFSALLTLLAGAPRRAGFAGADHPYRGDFFTHTVNCPAERHMSANFAALVAAPFDAAAGASASVVPLRPASPQRLILIHANLSDPVPQRRWPRDHYLALCRALLAAGPEWQLLFIGSAAEAPAAARLCAELGDARCACVAGDYAIAELPQLFARAGVLVSSDSGPAHFAAHAGLPVVALFGPETPQRYAPRGAVTTLYAGLACSPCLSAHSQRASACSDARCMAAIEVDAVLDAVRKAIAHPLRTQQAACA